MDSDQLASSEASWSESTLFSNKDIELLKSYWIYSAHTEYSIHQLICVILLWIRIHDIDEKSVDHDQLASSEASWSWSTLFSNKDIELWKSYWICSAHTEYSINQFICVISLLIWIQGVDENCVDHDQLASSEASWSGSTLFSNKDIELC